MTLEEFNEERRVLQENLDACKQAKIQIEAEIAILNNIKKDKTNKDEVIKLQGWANTKFFLNDEMIRCLRGSLRYLMEHKETDCVYDSYVNKYIVAYKQYIAKCQDVYYLGLANKYIGDVSAKLEQ